MGAFDQSTINGMELANRFVRSATWEGMADEEGRVSDELVEYIVNLARGGVGLIISGFMYVSNNSKAAPYQAGIHENESVLDLTRLGGAVHAFGGKICGQIVHGGIQASPALNNIDVPVGPSAVRVRGMKSESRELTTSEITEIVEDFARGAGRVRESGFDAVQLHVAHGYLLSQFLSPITNKRGDQYGGSIDNRARIVFETFEAVRSAVGPDFPVLIKINSRDFEEGGLTLEDSIHVSKKLAEMGLDAVEVSGGVGWSKEFMPSRLKIDSPEKEAYFREAGKAFKENVGAPIILVGGMRTLDVIEDVLDKGEADYIALSRPLIREPNLIKRWQNGDRSPATCISCNACGPRAAAGKGLACAVLAKEKE